MGFNWAFKGLNVAHLFQWIVIIHQHNSWAHWYSCPILARKYKSSCGTHNVLVFTSVHNQPHSLPYHCVSSAAQTQYWHWHIYYRQTRPIFNNIINKCYAFWSVTTVIVHENTLFKKQVTLHVDVLNFQDLTKFYKLLQSCQVEVYTVYVFVGSSTVFFLVVSKIVKIGSYLLEYSVVWCVWASVNSLETDEYLSKFLWPTNAHFINIKMLKLTIKTFV
jgi:hypothetical protein